MKESVNAAESGAKEDTRLDNKDSSSKIPIRLTMDKRIDLALAVVIVLVGVFIVVESRGIPEGYVKSAISSREMPLIAGVFLIICGIVLAAVRLINWSMLPGNLVPGEGHEDEEGHPSTWVRPFIIVLAAGLSVWLLDWAGYLIATPLLMFASFWFMGTRSWWKLIGFAVIYTILTWYVFSQILQFGIPLGFLEPFFRSLGLAY